MVSMRMVIAFVAAVALAGYLTRAIIREPPPTSHNVPRPPNEAPLVMENHQPPVLAPQAGPSIQVNAAVEQALRARVMAYWGARSRSNLLAAYPFYELSFRAKYSPEQFLESFHRLNRFHPKFQAIERIRFEPDGRTARVSVRLRTRPDVLMGKELDSITDETWRLIGTLWWREGEALLPTF